MSVKLTDNDGFYIVGGWCASDHVLLFVNSDSAEFLSWSIFFVLSQTSDIHL